MSGIKKLSSGTSILALCCLVGYSQMSATSARAAQAQGDGDDPPIRHIDCGKIFSPADVAGILKGHITISVYSMRDNACHFESADGSTFNLYSGDGFTDEIEWKEAVANRNGDFKPLAGVGDQAFYRGNRELMSKKADYFCAISGSGGNPPSEGLASKLGALCNKVFAAR